MALKIYHNPRCKYSRTGLEYLKSKTDDFEIREYLDEKITAKEIKEILLKTNLKPLQLVRTQEQYFKDYLKGKVFNEDEWIKIFVDNPKLIQRPIIVGKYKAVIGNPPEEIEKLLK